jgi:hypothetical protein
MKTFKTLLISLVILSIGFPSCKKYLDDVQVNPNAPAEATPGALLASIELATFSNYSSNNARTAAILTQQMAGTTDQMAQLANYQILEGDITNQWASIYNNAIINCAVLIKDFGAKNPYFSGITKILLVMNIGIATDLWGDVPFLEAGLGLDDSKMNPKYDSQESIYQGMQKLLSEAVIELSSPVESNKTFPFGDYVFQGDTEQWKKIAWLLKARYANHLSKRNPSGSATEALEYLQMAELTGNSDDANAVFGTLGNEINQWAAFEQTRGGYIRMGELFIDTLKGLSDPRLPFYAAEDDNGEYTGSSLNPETANIGSSAIGPYFGSDASPAPLATYVEAKFIEAEANQRLGNSEAAANAFNDAVKASLLQITGSSDAAYEAANASETAETINLEKIMFQKYIALFTQIEVWTDWRRTGFPIISPNPAGVINGIPRRLPGSQDERNYNSNAVIISNLLQPVWWDQ